MFPFLSLTAGVVLGAVLSLMGEPKLSMIAFLGGLGLAVASRSALWVFGAFLVSMSVIFNVPGTTLTPVKAMTPIVVLMIFSDAMRTKRLAFPPWRFLLPIVLLTMWMLVAELSSDSMAQFEYALVRISGILLLVWGVLQFVHRTEHFQIVSFIFAFNLLMMGATLPLFGSVSELFASEGARQAGIGGEPNWTGEIIARLTPFALAVMSDRRLAKWQRVIAAASIPSGVVALFACSSRGGTIAWLGGIATFSLLAPRRGRERFLWLGLAVLCALSLIALAPVSFSTRVLASAGLGEHKDYMVGADITSGRIHLTRNALMLVEQFPLFGIGYGGFAAWNLRNTGSPTEVHNGLLSLATAAGIPAALMGIFAYTVAVPRSLLLLQRTSEARVHLVAAVASFVASLIGMLNIPELLRAPVWISTALLLAWSRVAHAPHATVAAPSEKPAAPQGNRTPVFASVPPS